MHYERVSYGYAVVLAPATPQSAWRPVVDVYEAPTSVYVTVELAGVEIEEIDVALFDNSLVIEGRRRVPEVDAGGFFHAAEIRRGPFRAEIAVPVRVLADPIQVQSHLGLLSIKLARSTD
jgi:HSP20 family protein